jgi:hypothetical protein
MMTTGLIYGACGLASLLLSFWLGNGRYAWEYANGLGRVLLIGFLTVLWPVHALIWLVGWWMYR